MLKEIFYIEVATDFSRDDDVHLVPMEMGRIASEKFPSPEEIEAAIIKLEGNTAKIDKRYKLI